MPAPKSHHTTPTEKLHEENAELQKKVAELELKVSDLTEQNEKLTKERDAKHAAALEATRQAREAIATAARHAARDESKFVLPAMFYALKPGHDDPNAPDALLSRICDTQEEYEQLMADGKKQGLRWVPRPSILIREHQIKQAAG